MTTALDRARALLDTPAPAPIPGQLAVNTVADDSNHDEQQPPIHHQPTLWSL